MKQREWRFCGLVDGTPRREQVDVKIALPHNTHGTLSVTSLLVADAEVAANSERLLLDLGLELDLRFKLDLR